MKTGLAIAGAISAAMVVSAILTPYDDTDPPGFMQRSGLGLRTDAKTGCQYVTSGLFGGVTPRLDANGQPVCGKQTNP